MNPDYISEIAEALTENHAALMVGAGFSKNAERIGSTNKYFLDWGELSAKFYEVLYGPSQQDERGYINPLRLAQEVELVVGRPKLESILKEAIPDNEYVPSQLYDKLMEMPWRDIFTTNYDTLLERAAEKVTKRRYDIVVCQEDLVNSTGIPRIIKLHGSFPSHRPFIITEEDYRTYPKNFAAFVNTVQQALLENVFCMIGFSCEDPNFINWVGWIHDNLGKSNAQKIYMISVSHVSYSKRELLSFQNIVVVDLEEIYTGKSISERLESFVEELSERVTEEEKKENWFDLSKLNYDWNSSYSKKTDQLRKLNDSYPGWIVLPWKMKGKVDIILQEIHNLNKNFDEISYKDKVDYMYEYVRFCDIVGRPLIFEDVAKFWGILNDNDKEGKISEKDNLNDIEYKEQVIYLNLLRSFRELAEWVKYDECYAKINSDLLNYDQKQFLFACKFWDILYRFKQENLLNHLDNWKLASGDVYWPLIKASMYALIGEFTKAKEILTESLKVIRRRLNKSIKKEYLSSLEDCMVSLINYIGTANNKGIDFEETEETVFESDVLWWDENEKYCLHLKAEEEEIKYLVTSYNFDLSNTFSLHFGTYNQGIFHAMEYLRFLEQTGHPFRLGNVTNTKGLDSTIKILASYYPHWCLMQLLIAQNPKILDPLFGRAKLARYTNNEVDDYIEEYINAIHVVMNNVLPENAFWSKSFYDQAAAVLPEIVSRFCCKGTTKMLDKILDTMLEICQSNIRPNFKKLGIVFERLIKAYTLEEQGQRFEKFLMFPMTLDRRNDYYDPLIYIYKPKAKYHINSNIYENVIAQIKEQIEYSDDKEKRESAINRFISLAQVAILNKNDETYLCRLLEGEKSIVNDVILYEIDPVKYSEKPKEIFNATIQQMKQDSNKQIFSTRNSEYRDLLLVLKDLNIQEIDLVNAISIMKNLVQTNIPLEEKDDQYIAGERVRESFIITSGLLILRNKNNLSLTYEESEISLKYLSEFNTYLSYIDIIKALWSCIGVYEDIQDNEFYINIWTCGDQDILYIADFYDELYENKYPINDNQKLFTYSTKIYKMIICRLASNNEIDSLISELKLCRALLRNFIFESGMEILLKDLSKILKITIIQGKDSEEVARNKINCRIEACEVASLLYISGERAEVLDKWKFATEDENEFSEIRNIQFV